MIMAAMRVNSEDIRPRAHQQNVFATDMAEQGLADEFGQLDAQRQIRAGRWGFLISHILLPQEPKTFLFGVIAIGSSARQLIGCKSPLIGHSEFTLIRRDIKRVVEVVSSRRPGRTSQLMRQRAPLAQGSQTTIGMSDGPIQSKSLERFR